MRHFRKVQRLNNFVDRIKIAKKDVQNLKEQKDDDSLDDINLDSSEEQEDSDEEEKLDLEDEEESDQDSESEVSEDVEKSKSIESDEYVNESD